MGLVTSSEDIMAARYCSVRKLILVAIILVVFRITWTTLQAFRNEPPPLDVSDLPDSAFDLDFKPRTCIVEKGVCKPFEESDVPFPGKGLYAKGSHFYLDGRPFRILSGSFHYFRTQPLQWGDRLLRMKAAGLNTVTSYVPWNLHEPSKGQWMFGGRWDLGNFIRQVQKVGLKLILRPGPYICAEWEFGGLPAWLLSDPTMRVRSSHHKGYLGHVEEYFAKVLSMLAPYTYKRGGPIIAFQVENEFGSYSRDPKYMDFLVRQFNKWHMDEFLFTSDGTKQLSNGSVPNILATVNFNKKPREKLQELLEFQPSKPLMVTELWSGWFDHWGEKHHVVDTKVFEQLLDTVLRMNASINLYMFVGGTNFQFWNGANLINGSLYAPTVTSYDYDAPVSESGDIGPKYHVVRRLMEKYSLDPVDLPAIPNDPAKEAYGEVAISEWLPYTELVNAITMAHHMEWGPLDVLPDPVSMEQLRLANTASGQAFGWILYRSEIRSGSKLQILGKMADRCQVIVSGKEEGILDYTNASNSVPLPVGDNRVKTTLLDLWVENLGRVNFKFQLNEQRKGIMGSIAIDGQIQKNWTHLPIQMDDQDIRTLQTYRQWRKWDADDLAARPVGPGAYRAILKISRNPEDTFLDMKGWTKGVVIVNGFNVGRYWAVGPQRTLYVPGALLTMGSNSITVLELHAPGPALRLVDKHMLGDKLEQLKLPL